MGRKRRSGFSHGRGPYLEANIARLAQLGPVTRHSYHHWQLKVDGLIVNWWPNTGRWQRGGDISTTGTFEMMIAQVEAWLPTPVERKADTQVELLREVECYTPDGSPVYTWPLSHIPR